MKRLMITLLCLMSFCFLEAQDKRIIKDSFESNRFQWGEFYERKSSASIEDGFLKLDCDDDKLFAWTVAELPLDVDRSFNLTYSFHADVDDEYWFGIVFNFEDENNFNCFVVQEKRFRLINMINGVMSISRRSGIVLKGGDRDVKIVMEKRGKKIVFHVDDMEVISVTKEVTSNVFGCIVLGDETIKLTEVVMEQITEN